MFLKLFSSNTGNIYIDAISGFNDKLPNQLTQCIVKLMSQWLSVYYLIKVVKWLSRTEKLVL